MLIFRVLFIVICLLPSVLVTGQSKVETLKKSLAEKYGKEKLLVLHDITEQYLLKEDGKRATKYAKQADVLADAIISEDNRLLSEQDLKLKPLTYLWLGKAQYQKKDYYDAKKAFEKATLYSEPLGASDITQQASVYLDKLDSLVSKKQNSFLSNFKDLNIERMIHSSATDINLAAALKLAKTYENKKNYTKAIEQYQKSINYLKDKGDGDQVVEIKAKVAELYEKNGQYESALNSYKEIKSIELNTGDPDLELMDADKMIRDLEKRTAAKSDRPVMERIEPLGLNIDNIDPGSIQSQNLKKLAAAFEQREDYQKSLSYYKLYIEANRKMAEEEHLKELELLEFANQVENQSTQITLLQQEKELQELNMARNEAELTKQTRFRNTLLLGALFLLSFALALYTLYKKKKKAHVDLTKAYNDLHVTQKHLAKAEKRIKTLLEQQVSSAVADELLSGATSQQISRRFVCVMFLDIRDFTPFAESRKPEEIIKYQNDLFEFMIEIIHKNHGIINQFLGDGFMATFGVPTSAGNDCDNAYNSARQILDTLNSKNQSGKIPFTKVGIGLHAGPVVTGNVGTDDRKQYSITGNTVILASRIEQLNKKYNTQLLLSEEVLKELSPDEIFVDEGEEQLVKGRTSPIRIYKYQPPQEVVDFDLES